ncbi:MAG: Hsp20/alpha crystallin family protein [Halanaeroarchaeum sp.]
MDGFTDAFASLPEAVFADVLESEDSYRLVFDVPGVNRDSLSVTVTDRRLSIEGRREKDVPDEFWFREEHRDLFLDVEAPLPPDANVGEATASLEAGVLEVTIPKAADSGVRVPIEG